MLLRKHIAIVVCLLACTIWSMDLHAQAPAPASGRAWAIKVHMYAPLSLLALPFDPDSRNVPFAPRMYHVEGEVGLGAKSSCGVVLGLRHKIQDDWFYEQATGFRSTVYFRQYLGANPLGALKGWYLSPFARLQLGSYETIGYDDGTKERSHALSIGCIAGRQWVFGNRLILDLGLGLDSGVQTDRIDNYRWDPAYYSTFDLAGWDLGHKDLGAYDRRFWGLAIIGQFALGWRF